MSSENPSRPSRLRDRGLGLVVGALLTYGGLWIGGGLQGRDPAPPPRADLLLNLGQTLDAEHRRVDLLLERGDTAAAIANLEALRARPWPDVAEAGDTVIALRHDLYGRLLRLRLDHPTVDPRPPAELLALTDEAMTLGGAAADNAFTARLLALRGELLEGLGRDDEALAAYERALAINRRLLDALLAPAGDRGAP